ncbi:MAG: sensor histidine kinase [Acidimicrobiales bacterium]
MSLRRRLTLVMAVLLIAGVFLADALTYSSLRSFLNGRIDDQIDGAQLRAYHYLTVTRPRLLERSESHALGPRLGTLSFERDQLESIVGPDVYLLVLSRSAKVIVRASSGPLSAPDPQPLVPAALRPAPFPRSHRYGALAGAYRSEPDSADVGSLGSTGVSYRESAVDVPQGVMVVAVGLGPTHDTLASLLRVQIGASIGVLIVLVALVLYTLRRGLRPLEAMAETTDAIATGELHRRVPLRRASSEVSRLGVALNSMLARIEEAFFEKSASEERLRQFVADASHELRTPLTSILGYSELLRRGAFADDKERSGALARVEGEAKRMGVLVDDLLLLARLDQGRPLQSVPVDLSALAAEAVADARAVDPSRPLELRCQGPVLVQGDPARLGQVAHNLVRNAIEHTPPSTGVVVETLAEGAQGKLLVRDQGPGLSVEDAQKVFDRFWRRDAARGGGGSGLGLSIVRAISEALGGQASVVSSPGHGATFCVALPISAPPAAPPSPEALREQSSGAEPVTTT